MTQSSQETEEIYPFGRSRSRLLEANLKEWLKYTFLAPLIASEICF